MINAFRYFIFRRTRVVLGRKLFAFLAFFLILIMGCGGGGGGSSGDEGSSGSGGVIQLIWDSNTEEDLSGYRVYYGIRSGAYEDSLDVGMATRSGNSTTYSLANLIKGQAYCIAVTAYDTLNNESEFSEEVCGDAW